MQIKWFFVIVGLFFTITMLLGQLFIGSYVTEQDRKQFEKSQYNVNVIHQNVFDNLTELKTKLDPILDTIPNATKSMIDQTTHYNQTDRTIDTVIGVDKLLSAYSNGTERIEREKQDHAILILLNHSVYKILEVLNNTSNNNNGTTIIPIPVPIIVNETAVEKEKDKEGLRPFNSSSGPFR